MRLRYVLLARVWGRVFDLDQVPPNARGRLMGAAVGLIYINVARGKDCLS